MKIKHYEKVDKVNIISDFTILDNEIHRSSLIIPFLNRKGIKTLCIIGQNPSLADEENADKTINFLEKLVYEYHEEYSKIIMLNLYSRVDTYKNFKTNLETPETFAKKLKHINENTDFLLVFGKLVKDGEYDFHAKFEEIKPLLTNKNLFKLDTGTETDYAPHPGNPKIFYSNLKKIIPYKSNKKE